jgi:hypothetical protein
VSGPKESCPDREDLTTPAPVAGFEGCLAEDDLDLAKAVYQLPKFESEGAFFALLDKHGLQYLPDSGEWRAPNGLSVEVDGRIEERALVDVSYLTVRGPAGAVASFVEGLLEAAVYIKRELLAPALVEIADEGQERRERVKDTGRLVKRERAADVVGELPRSDSQ